MSAYLTAPATTEGKVLVVILIIGVFIIKGIFKKFFPNVPSLKEVIITAVILLAVTIIYMILVTS